MDLARYVVEAVVLEGRSCREVARSHGVSKSWVSELVRRYQAGGYNALAPRSRQPLSVPSRTTDDLVDEIVRLRKQLAGEGLDAGAQTIHYHLSQTLADPPSVATIWRALSRRGFIVPEPHKRPRSSLRRFEAKLPNQCWQADMTHWKLADGSKVEIVNFLDDCSRLCLGSRAMPVATAGEVVSLFRACGQAWGLPESILTDNGCIFTAWHRGGSCALELELVALGIAHKRSRPNHPQTCGKVERFHQTLKQYLAKQGLAGSLEELQAQIDRFVEYYNTCRPHRAKDRITPQQAFDSLAKAKPSCPPQPNLAGQMRVRRDKVDKNGKVTLRYRGRLLHIGVGWANRGRRVTLLVDGRDVRVVDQNGELLRHLTVDPTRNYQGLDLECPR
ncbi:MAG: IS481 family transposase [Actinomycetota bacterium]